MDILLEVARSLFIFSEPPKRKEPWLFLQHIDDAFTIDEKWINLSDDDRQIWISKAKEFLDEIEIHFPYVYESIMKGTICVNDKPMWWKNYIFE
jgi:hypothetical protein